MLTKSTFRSPLLVLLLIFSFHIQAQHFLSTNGKAIVNEDNDTILLRGMGLGGWMVQEGYMLQTASFANPQHEIRATIQELIGEENTNAFYEKWLANHVTKVDVDSLKSWGFNSVRLPMHYNLYTLPIEEESTPGENTWLDKGFALTDSIISWCKQNEMYVILDLHASPGGQGKDAAISDYDSTKPSLWESEANQDKMVALWGRLAERYKDEQWVAGYDLLNEPNWELPGGTALRNIYERCTEAIREVDTEHIIFIEGNWFANDFTGLTPPWDDNLVYSPHKYWSYNDKNSIQGFLDLRDAQNVPLYLGESGENSNVWFRDAIRLLEDEGIGWAWWPMKKIESIAGPTSVVKTEAYQSLLDYWNDEDGAETPTAEFGTETLMNIAEGLKMENLVFQKDVIDAMFRQVYSDETTPFGSPQKIPGIVYPTDFDLGVIGKAYYDNESGNYQVSSGTYTSWNNGWIYRNDGVDIERTEDNVNSNGYNIGWIGTGEWMNYMVDVDQSGVYDINVRVASNSGGGSMHFEMGNSAITPKTEVPSTSGWQTWQTLTFSDVYIDKDDSELKFYCDAEGFNLGSFEFVATGKVSTDIATKFVAATTVDEYAFKLNINKFITSSSPLPLNDFQLFVNGTAASLNSVSLEQNDNRILNFTLNTRLRTSDVITVSYNGSQIITTDGTFLDAFSNQVVTNNLELVHEIPTKIEAEDYFFQSGISLETTSDVGGGQNIGFLDPGDYLDYEVNIAEEGTYLITYRIASQSAAGQIGLKLIDTNGNETSISSPNFVVTGGWQDWLTISEVVNLPSGRYVMRIEILKSPFNLNWMEFSMTTSLDEEHYATAGSLRVFPNPSRDIFNLSFDFPSPQDLRLQVLDLQGQSVFNDELEHISKSQYQLILDSISNGVYILKIELKDGTSLTRKLFKQ